MTIKVIGLHEALGMVRGAAQQVPFAAAKALTQTAHAVVADLKGEMRSKIQGGPTAFTLRAFRVAGANKNNLTAEVSLRSDAPAGGTAYDQALKHLFTGGTRQWKKLEGWLRGRRLIPSGYMIAPGPSIPLDGRGNIYRSALREMTEILASETRNAQIVRESGRKGRYEKAIGFFVAMPGDRSGLQPGIWRRINAFHTGLSLRRKAKKSGSSVVEPWITYIRPPNIRQRFDLRRTAKVTVDRELAARFRASLAGAIRSAR